MPRGQTISLSFPPFAGWVRKLSVTYAAISLLRLIILAFSPDLDRQILQAFALIPELVVRGWIWQLLTYSFIHLGLLHLIFNVLMLWMFGADLESDWGSKRFLEFFLFCVAGAAVTTIVVSYTGVMGVQPSTPTVGASGGIFGILAAFGLLYGDREVGLFPFFFIRFRAKYLIAGLIFIEVYLALPNASARGDAVAHVAHVGGALVAWLYLRFLPRRGLTYGVSEQYFGVRNWYYRWKRRRAAKKFEVYMRDQDRQVTFDEHGNYVPPDDGKPDKKNGGGPSGWVN
jgi:membrane associated rhomboid family serine protease